MVSEMTPGSVDDLILITPHAQALTCQQPGHPWDDTNPRGRLMYRITHFIALGSCDPPQCLS